MRYKRTITGMRLFLVSIALWAIFFCTGLTQSYAQSSAQSSPNLIFKLPIKYLVVIFQENVSFDHYFGTYPNATNPSNEPNFYPDPNTPSVNGLNNELLTDNPNSANPVRLDRSQPFTCDQNHDYTPEQKAFDHGLMDMFVENTTGTGCQPPPKQELFFDGPGVVMDYYDGNTVTALWNYAQNFAMNDNSYGTTFGPSTPGHLNLISGQTHGATPASIPDNVANGTVIGDPDPTTDDCSGSTTVELSGKNVGDLLNAKGVTWGWFQGGFKPTSVVNGKAVCGASSVNIGGATVTDYSAHHEPFQYYQSTANLHHLPPLSVMNIGHTDQANHQYDLSDFWAAANARNIPAVSFLKAAKYQDAHAGYSDPLDEQTFLVNTINALQKLPQWSNMAIIIAYDDSDGWYDHVMGPIVSQSNDAANDALTDPGLCGTPKAGAFLDRCGYGPRLPLLVISPFSKENFVDHSITDQSSILRFIEDNWNLGQIGDQSFDEKAGSLLNMFDFAQHGRNIQLILDPVTGQLTQ
jgi:phospholipase C